MRAKRVQKSDEYVLNHCAKCLARFNADHRHSFFGSYDAQPRGKISESWRFPLIDSHEPIGEESLEQAYECNDVTFVFCDPPGRQLAEVTLVSTCSPLHESYALARISDSIYWSCTLCLPKAERYRYQFLIDGRLLPDPINPQTVTLGNGEQWSSFFTWAYNQPITFERWELAIIERLTRHVLPFKSKEAEIFLKGGANDGNSLHLYRLHTSVGVSNYIDKLLAREERHHLYAYRTCLEMIDRILRTRYDGKEPAFLDRNAYEMLYHDMADATPALFRDGWQRSRYDSPFHFLYLLRRHAITGAFSHPKYGGNAGAMGWAYMGEHFRSNSGATAFDWRQAMEPPMGSSTEYRG